MQQLQDFLIRWNDIRPFHSTFFNKISGNGSKWIVRLLANFLLPLHFRHHPGIKEYRKAQQEGRVSHTIVSLTSFPQRIGVVWLVIECLLRQTRIPYKIVIYLSRDQFPTEDCLPDSLKSYPNDIVDIQLVDGDIRSHKKYWYAVEDFKKNPLILVDDDLVYDSHMIEDLETAASRERKVVSCCWGLSMSWDETGKIKPYSKWIRNIPVGNVSNNIFFGSGGGTYFPVGSLDGANQPIQDIMNTCPTADDIWLNAIIRKNKYCVCLIRNYTSMPEWIIYNNRKLYTINNGRNQNDTQLINVSKYMQRIFNMDPFSVL